MGARFDEVLQRTEPVRGVGDLRLRFDGDLLIGERQRRVRTMSPHVVWVGAFSAALIALVVSLRVGTEGGWLWLAVLLGLVAAGLLAVSSAWEGHQRSRRGFVLHFGTESLRVDDVTLKGEPWTRHFPFDDVQAVEVARARRQSQGFELYAHVRTGTAEAPGEAWCLLAGRVREDEAEALERLRTFLLRAFGVRPSDETSGDALRDVPSDPSVAGHPAPSPLTPRRFFS